MEKKEERNDGFFSRLKAVPGKIVGGVVTVGKVIWDNKEILGLVLGTAGLVGEAVVATYEMKLDMQRLSTEQKDRVCRFEDPATGNYSYAKRPLTIEERRELEHVVYEDGNSLAETLIGMDLYDPVVGK